MSNWKVVPLSPGQLLDVGPADILEGGLYRKCDTYKGGGGYDQFPAICERRLGMANMHCQFVVQLRGCHLDCPYCYVTRAGVWGKATKVSTVELLAAFKQSRQQVFHLMGGAPAIFMNQWPDLVEQFVDTQPGAVFHSDLLLTERRYSMDVLYKLAQQWRSLYAVDVKGLTNEEHLRNTRKPFREDMFWSNLSALVEVRLQFYITFTNISPENQERFWQRFTERESPRVVAEQRVTAFSIDLIEYNAQPHVDSIAWGG